MKILILTGCLLIASVTFGSEETKQEEAIQEIAEDAAETKTEQLKVDLETLRSEVSNLRIAIEELKTKTVDLDELRSEIQDMRIELETHKHE